MRVDDNLLKAPASPSVWYPECSGVSDYCLYLDATLKTPSLPSYFHSFFSFSADPESALV